MPVEDYASKEDFLEATWFCSNCNIPLNELEHTGKDDAYCTYCAWALKH